MLIKVSLSFNIFECLTYEFPENGIDIIPGMRVVVPVGNRITTGWVIGINSKYSGKVKRVIGIIEDPVLPDTAYLKFARAVSESYFTSTGMVLDHSLPPKFKSMNNLYFLENGKIRKLNSCSREELEKSAKNTIFRFQYRHGYSDGSLPRKSDQGSKIIPERRFILGYERIHCYREIIREYSGKYQCVLFATPDHSTARFYHEGIQNSDFYHSQQKSMERERIWYRALNGEPSAVIGGLSAVMLPIKNLGCVISERAGSYQYQRTSYTEFKTNQIARLRAEIFNVPFIEGFSSFNSDAYLKKKQILVEDYRKDKHITVNIRRIPSRDRGIPQQLIELLKMYFLNKRKILLVVNRKKTSQYLFCQNCKKYYPCPGCSGVSFVGEGDTIKCARCGYNKGDLKICSKCDRELVFLKDIGMDGIREEIRRKLSEEEVFTLSAENTDDIPVVLSDIRKNKIVISTTIILNPFFTNIFDVIIYLRPESILSMNVFNTGEMVFSMVSELRELVKEEGVIDIFSVFHFHYSLQLVNQEDKFFQRELKYRNWFLLPPFYTVYTLEIKSNDLRSLGAEMREIYKKFKTSLNIRRLNLISRERMRGKYKGEMELHSTPQAIVESSILGRKNLGIQVLAI